MENRKDTRRMPPRYEPGHRKGPGDLQGASVGPLVLGGEDKRDETTMEEMRREHEVHSGEPREN